MQLDELKNWFLESQRKFPWRENKTPYRVWISEVMLQQTRAVVVIDYFERWMETFPTIEVLAASDLETVIKLWEGLGYYTRARNIHLGAKQIVEKFQGSIPSTYEELLSIRGIGPYTASAILAFAFEQKAPALDGNVMRVLARLLGFEKDVTKHAKELRLKLLALLPDEEAFIVMEALIELGATICMKKPLCHDCPLSPSCHALQTKTTDLLPIKKSRDRVIKLRRFIACIEAEGAFLVRLVAKGEIMADLWEFPYFEIKDEEESFFEDEIEKKWGLSLEKKGILPKQKGHFTRYSVEHYPVLYKSNKKEVMGYQWIKWEDLPELAFSSAHRRILESVLEIKLRAS